MTKYELKVTTQEGWWRITKWIPIEAKNGEEAYVKAKEIINKIPNVVEWEITTES